MVGCEGFPVRHEHFRENVIFDLGIHLQIDEGGGVAGGLRHENVRQGKADHGGKGSQKLSGLMAGDNIHQILGDQAGNQGDTGPRDSEKRIENHGFPVASAVLENPFGLCPHFPESSLL